MKGSYIITNTLKDMYRRPETNLQRFLFLFFYLFFLSLLSRTYIILSKANTDTQNKISVLNQSNSDENLGMLLYILYICVIILLITLLVMGGFFYIVFYMKNFLIRRNELCIQLYLGASPFEIALPFFIETLITGIFASILAIPCIEQLYLFIIDHSSEALRVYLIQPGQLSKITTMPLFMIILILSATILLITYGKMRTSNA